MLANLSIQVIPINQENAYGIIDEALKVIKESGIKHIVGPFSTSLEGELETLMALVDQVRKTCLEAGAIELILNIQIHLHKNKDASFEDKIEQWA